jgi:hypothetical protein
VRNGDRKNLRQAVGYSDARVLGNHAPHVVLGQNWFRNNTQTQQVASTIHEALHIQMRMGDVDLKGWLATNFGFKGASFGTGDITDWIAEGCK